MIEASPLGWMPLPAADPRGLPCGHGPAPLVLWEWADTGGSTVTVIDDDSRLPRDDASWSRMG